MRAFVVISQADAALTTEIAFESLATPAAPSPGVRRSPSSRQRNACIWSKQTHRSFPALQLAFRQRSEEGSSDPRPPAHRPEAARRPGRSQPRQARDRRRASRDDHFLALFCALDEAGELGFGRMNGVGLLHDNYVS